MRKLGVIIMLIFAFFFLQVIWLPPFEVAAQSSLSNLNIVSPQNKTYKSQFLTLNATINFVMARIESMSYSIDGLGSYSFSNHFHSEDSTIIHGTQIWLATLTDLAEGPHSITVYLEGTLYFPDESHYSEQATVYFTVENTPSSHTAVPSPTPLPSPTASPAPSPTASPSPVPTPISTPIPYQEPKQTEQDLTAGAIFAVASIVVFLGLLFYFIKKR